MTSHPEILKPLASFTPALPSRAWLSLPHPSLPLLATATASQNTIQIYSLTSFTRLSTISGGHRRSVRAVAWQPSSGKTTGESVLVSGSFDATVGVWRRFESVGQNEMEGEDDEEEEDWRFTVLLDGHESEVKSVAFNAGGQLLATCGRDKSVWIWEELEPDNWETVAVLQEHEGDVKCVAWHPTEDLLASSSYDDDVRLYREDVDDWVCCALLRGHESTVWSVSWEKKPRMGESRLASSSGDGVIKVWRRTRKAEEKVEQKVPSILRTRSVEEEWECEGELPKIHERAVYAIDWSSVSGRIVATGSDGRVVVYEEISTEDKCEWKVVAELEEAHGVYEVNHVCWVTRRDRDRRADDEEMIVTTGDDGEVKAWILDK